MDVQPPTLVTASLTWRVRNRRSRPGTDPSRVPTESRGRARAASPRRLAAVPDAHASRGCLCQIAIEQLFSKLRHRSTAQRRAGLRGPLGPSVAAAPGWAQPGPVPRSPCSCSGGRRERTPCSSRPGHRGSRPPAQRDQSSKKAGPPSSPDSHVPKSDQTVRPSQTGKPPAANTGCCIMSRGSTDLAC